MTGSGASPPSSGSLDGWSTEECKRLGTVAYRSVRHLLDDEEDTQDVVQKTMRALWAVRDAPPDDVDAWVRRVARCRAIDVIRSRTQERSLLEQLRTLVCPNDALCASQDDEVIAKMVIQTLLPKLPAREREALELRFLQDLDRQTIAELMQVRLSTVKTLLRRGLEHLREAFTASVVEGGDC